MSRQAREERSRRRSGSPKNVRGAAPALFFLFCFASGFGAAAVVRSAQRAGVASREPAPVSGARRAEAERRFQKGVEAFDSERYSEAFEEFARSAELDATDPRPQHGLGKIYDRLFLRDKAELSYRNAIAADPGYRPSKESLAMLLYEKGLHGDAVAILRDLQKETPDDPFVWGELAINASATGQPGKAIELLERYNAVKGKQAWGYTNLARAYADSGLLEKAEAAYREAIAIDPRFSRAHYWLGQLLVATKRETEARPVLETYRRLQQLSTEEHEAKMALLTNPADVRALMALARVHFLLGRSKESLAALDRALALTPGDPKILELREKAARSLKGER